MAYQPLIPQGYFIDFIEDIPERKRRNMVVLYSPDGTLIYQDELMHMTEDEYRELNSIPADYNAAQYEHYFCGPHQVDGAWCPNCRLSLIRLLSLDTTDPRLSLQNEEYSGLSIFYCFRCDLCAGPFSYRIEGNERISILQAVQRDTITWGWGQEDDWKQPEYYPGTPVRLTPLSRMQHDFYEYLLTHEDHDNAILDALFPQSVQIHLWDIQRQIGGPTFLCQGWRDIYCPCCTREMPFLLSLNDDCLLERGLTGESIQIMVAYCKECRVISIAQASWT